MKTSVHFQNGWKMSVYFYPVTSVSTDSKIKRVGSLEREGVIHSDHRLKTKPRI